MGRLKSKNVPRKHSNSADCQTNAQGMNVSMATAIILTRIQTEKNIAKKVKCSMAVTEEACVCPQVYDPVCDLQGNVYSNQECALCDGADIGELGPCFGNGSQTGGPM